MPRASPVPPEEPHLSADAGLLQQVLLDLRPFNGTPLVEMDVDVFTEPAGVVITNRLCIAKSCG